MIFLYKYHTRLTMKKIFLSSSFKDVVNLFKNFANEEIRGKTITFIPTAGIPEEMTFYIDDDKKALESLGIIIDELEISKASSKEITSKLKNNDYIFISGGNTFFLLQELKKSGADKIIIEEINSEKLFIGVSAGAIITSPNIEYIKDMDECEKASELDNYNSLSVVNFYTVPHYGNFPFRESAEKIINSYNSKLKLIPISNSQVITVKGDEIKII